MANAPSKEIQDRALKFVTDTNTAFDSIVSQRRAKWLDWYKMYRLFKTEERQPWQSKLFIPKVFEVIERMLPAVVANRPRYILTPRYNDAVPRLGLMKEYLDYAWDEGKLQRKIESLAKSGLMYGNGIVKLRWVQVTRMETSAGEPEPNDETGELEPTEVEEEVVAFEYPTFDNIDIFNFKTDPFCSLDDSVANIHVQDNVSLSELEADGDKYFNLDLIQPTSMSGFDEDTSEEKNKFESTGYSIIKTDVNALAIKECWCRWSPTGETKDEEEYVITTVNNSIPIRIEKNEMGIRPFAVFRDKIIPNEFYAIGEIEPLEDLQIELNTLRNQRMDFANTILNPEWLVSTEAGINPSQLIHKPNNIIIADDISQNSIRMLEMRGVPIAGYNEEAQILRDFQTVSQTTDVTDPGGARGFANTAAGVRERSAQQKNVSGTIARHLEWTIEDIGRKFMMMAEHHLDGEDITIRRPDANFPGGTKFTDIKADAFKDSLTSFDVKVEAGSTLEHNFADKGNQAVAVGNSATQFAQAGVPINMTEVWKDIMKKQFFVDNPERFLTEPQPTESQLTEGEQVPGEFTPEQAQLQPTLPPL